MHNRETLRPGEENPETTRETRRKTGEKMLAAAEGAAQTDQVTPAENAEESIEDTEKALARQSIKYAIDSCQSTERRFQMRLTKLKERGEEMPKEMFERFENSYAHDWGTVKKEVAQAGMGLAEEAELEEGLFHVYNDQVDLNKWSIDVRAADYYRDRQDQLTAAIEQSDDPEKEADLAHVKGFYDKVYDHVEFRYMPRDEVADMGYEAYESQRSDSHNGLIRYFNHMNELCEKYGTRRFTVRDFWDTGAYKGMSAAEREQRQTLPMRKRYRNDRDIVEEYYARAFASTIQRFEAKLRRDLERQKMFGN